MGVKRRLLLTSPRFTYSLKVNTIRFPLKFRVESGGLASTSTGGKLSAGPPEGGMILAQPGPLIELIKTNRIPMDTKTDFMIMFANISCFLLPYSLAFLINR
jgi:hypothetical protein